MRRCYIEWGDGTACEQPAEYLAELAWTAGPMQLCRDHAAEERAHDDVLSISNLERQHR